MRSDRCLVCYRPLDGLPGEYHPACSKKLFGTTVPPELPITSDDVLELAEQSVQRSATVTGVQTKLSIGILHSDTQTPDRFTIMGVWGSHILKPPSEVYPNLVELEDLTMHLAELAGIKCVPHGLLRMKASSSRTSGDGALAYITRRIDRVGKPGAKKASKLHMEDLCQLTERLTEHKYRGSHEQAAKAIIRFSQTPVFDVIGFYEQVLFGFLTGNADMHLKNFSLLRDADGHYRLAPAYDQVPTALLLKDNEEIALTLNGRKSKIYRADFETAMRAGGLNERAIANLFNRFAKALPKWKEFIPLGFVPEELKARYATLIDERAARMELRPSAG